MGVLSELFAVSADHTLADGRVLHADVLLANDEPSGEHKSLLPAVTKNVTDARGHVHGSDGKFASVPDVAQSDKTDTGEPSVADKGDGVPEKPKATVATTPAEHAAVAKQEYVTGKANFDGISSELAGRVNGHFAARRLNIPALYGQKFLDEVVVSPKKTKALAGIATAGGRKVLHLFKSAGSPDKFEKEWDRSKEHHEQTGSPLYASSHLPRERAVESVMDHELAHVVQAAFSPNRQKEWLAAHRSVPKSEWEKVSVMSGLSQDEAFSEAFLLAANGKADMLPKPVAAFITQAVFHGKIVV